jgi:hypothetical protein
LGITNIAYAQKSAVLVCCDANGPHITTGLIFSLHQQSVSRIGSAYVGGTQALSAIVDQHALRFELTSCSGCSVALESTGPVGANPLQGAIVFSSAFVIVGLSRCCDYSIAGAHADALVSRKCARTLAGAASIWGNVYALGLGGHFGMPPPLYSKLFLVVLRRVHWSGVHMLDALTVRRMSLQVGVVAPPLNDCSVEPRIEAPANSSLLAGELRL